MSICWEDLVSIICASVCAKKISSLYGVGFERKMASHWRKRVWSLSSPIFLVLYNSFLCHCLTSIIIMLPDNFLPPFSLHESVFVYVYMCWVWTYLSMGRRLEFHSNIVTDSAQQPKCCGIDRSRSGWELSYLSILQGGCDKLVSCQFRDRSRENQRW